MCVTVTPNARAFKKRPESMGIYNTALVCTFDSFFMVKESIFLEKHAKEKLSGWAACDQ